MRYLLADRFIEFLCKRLRAIDSFDRWADGYRRRGAGDWRRSSIHRQLRLPIPRYLAPNTSL
jgi:hypothetical protein